jgi:hypothetical protein
MYLFGFVMLFAESDGFFLFDSNLAKLVYWLIMGAIFIFLYFTLLNLKRVEFDKEYFYISNYFKTIKVPIQSIEGIYLKPVPFIFSKIRLINKGTMGKVISFIPDKVGVSALKSIHSALLK